MQNNLAVKEYVVIDEEKKKYEKLKLRIISSFRTQICKDNLMFFTLDNEF